MLSADQLDSMRSTVEDTYVDACTIRAATAHVFDRNTGTYTDTAGSSVYSGACRFAPLGSRTIAVGEEPLTLHQYRVRLPWDTTGVEVDHLVTVDVSNDPHLDGRVLRVIDVQGMTDPLGRSVIAEDDLG